MVKKAAPKYIGPEEEEEEAVVESKPPKVKKAKAAKKPKFRTAMDQLDEDLNTDVPPAVVPAQKSRKGAADDGPGVAIVPAQRGKAEANGADDNPGSNPGRPPRTAKTTRTAATGTGKAAKAAPKKAAASAASVASVPAQRAGRGRRSLTPQERAAKPVTATIAAYIYWLDEHIFEGKMTEPQKKAAGIAITLYGAFQASPERKKARGV